MIDGFVRRYNGAGDIDWTELASGVASDGSAVYVSGVTVGGLNRAHLGKFSPVDGTNEWFRILEAPVTGGHSGHDVAVRSIGTETAV